MNPAASSEVPAEPAKDSTSRARMPSLNQLAARINPGAVPAPTSNSSRPRLATSILARTSSATSTSTSASTATAHSSDSTAVNPPTTRPVSPTGSTATGGGSGSRPPSPPPEGIPQVLVDKETDKGGKPPRGYKNIPSLDAITERMRSGMGISRKTDPATAAASGSAVPSAPSTEAKQNDSGSSQPQEKAAEKPAGKKDGSEHPLQHTWTLYHDTKSKIPFTPHSATIDGTPAPYVPPPSTESGVYEAGLTTIGEFNTVEGFCRYFNWLKPPSKLERNSNYHLFKDGIKPMWEDPANANGGKWVLTIKNNPTLLDRCWSWLAMALVGEELDEKDEICGAVVSLRSKIDRIQLWTRSKEDVEKINSLGKKLVKLLDVENEPTIGLEFQYNTEDRPTPSKFLSIQSQFVQSTYGSSYRGYNSPHTATTPGFPTGPSTHGGHQHSQSVGDGVIGGQSSAFAPGWRGRKY